VSQVRNLTLNFTVVTLKMWALQPPKSPKLVIFGINFPQSGIPLKRFFFQNFGWGRVSRVCNLTPNFAAVALKMWAYNYQNCKKMVILVYICPKGVYPLKQFLQNLAWAGSSRYPQSR